MSIGGVDWGPLTQSGALGQEHQKSSFLFDLIKFCKELIEFSAFYISL